MRFRPRQSAPAESSSGPGEARRTYDLRSGTATLQLLDRKLESATPFFSRSATRLTRSLAAGGFEPKHRLDVPFPVRADGVQHPHGERDHRKSFAVSCSNSVLAAYTG